MLKFRTVVLAVPAVVMLGAGAVAQVSPTLKKIQDRGAIVIGHNETSVPFSYIDPNQKPIGFTVDLCLKIADAVKDELKKPDIKINYVPVTPPQTPFALLANGTIDLECGSTTNTFSRQSQAAFTFTIFITGTKIMVRKDSGIKSVDDLGGKSLVVGSGGHAEQVLKAYIEQRKMNTRVLNAYQAEALLAMETGRADAYGSDEVLLYGSRSRAKNPDQYVVVGEFLGYDPYAIMLPRNDSAFATLANKAIAKMFRDGSFMQVYRKWIDPIGLPLNPLLEAAIKLQALPD